jgi:AmmeMemoRadiSam system protein A
MTEEYRLSQDERLILLKLARQAIEAAVYGTPPPHIELSQLPEALQAPGASFVTLTKRGELRGCLGTLEASHPLALDVIDHAAAAALSDYRFSPVTPEEVPQLDIEISRLTCPCELNYRDPDDLLNLLKPGIDGVVISDGSYRATFLPQVWDKIPNKEQFLSYLCRKMGANAGLWRIKKLQVYTYQVEEFHEEIS